MKIRLNRPWATTRGAAGRTAFSRARTRAARAPADERRLAPGRAGVDVARAPLRAQLGDAAVHLVVERQARPDAPVELDELEVEPHGEAVRRGADLGRLPGAGHRARDDVVELGLGEADGEGLGLAAAAPGQRRVEPAALKGPAEVPFALTVADEEDLHSRDSTNPYHRPSCRGHPRRSSPLSPRTSRTPRCARSSPGRSSRVSEIFDELVDAASAEILRRAGAWPVVPGTDPAGLVAARGWAPRSLPLVAFVHGKLAAAGHLVASDGTYAPVRLRAGRPRGPRGRARRRRARRRGRGRGGPDPRRGARGSSSRARRRARRSSSGPTGSRSGSATSRTGTSSTRSTTTSAPSPSRAFSRSRADGSSRSAAGPGARRRPPSRGSDRASRATSSPRSSRPSSAGASAPPAPPPRRASRSTRRSST